MELSLTHLYVSLFSCLMNLEAAIDVANLRWVASAKQALARPKGEGIWPEHGRNSGACGVIPVLGNRSLRPMKIPDYANAWTLHESMGDGLDVPGVQGLDAWPMGQFLNII